MQKLKKILCKYEGYLLTAPLLLGCLLFYAVPFVLVLRFSLFLGAGNSSAFVGLENYRRVLGNDMFRLAFGNTLAFLAVGLPLLMVLAYLIALLLKAQAEKHRLLKSVFMLPYIMPVVGTVLLVDLIFTEAGGLNWLLSLFQIPANYWLDRPAAFWIVELLYLWKNTGYAVILLLAGLMTISGEQYESASLDGATAFQKFRFITTPQMWYSVFFAVVFSLINAFKCFREIFLIGGEHPNLHVYMLQHFLNNSFQGLNYAKLSVASVVLLVALLLLFSIFYAFIRKREV